MTTTTKTTDQPAATLADVQAEASVFVVRIQDPVEAAEIRQALVSMRDVYETVRVSGPGVKQPRTRPSRAKAAVAARAEATAATETADRLEASEELEQAADRFRGEGGGRGQG